MRGEPGEVVFGRYRIEHQIGRGGFGRIYLARQVALSRDVALKASAVDQRQDVAMRERFRREAVLVASITHPNVVTYHDFGTDEDGDMILVMEYLRGRSLHEVIRSGETWPIRDVSEMVRQAADGLFAAHQAGIVHRDVKPSNLFVINMPTPAHRGEGRALASPKGAGFHLKVIDFGILRVDAGVRPDLPDLTAPEAVIGTPAYLAPEMLIGTRPDPRADQYALALVACELLTGRRAFGGPKDPNSLLSRVSRVPPELDLVPEGPASVLRQALSPDREERYDTVVDFARAFAHQVEALVAGSEATTRSIQPTTPISASQPVEARPKRQFSRNFLFIAAFAIVSGSAIAWWASGPAPSSPPPAPLGPTMVPASRAMEVPVLSGREDIVPLLDESRPPSSNRNSKPHLGGRREARAGPPATFTTEPGYLTINARPWANVRLDGTALGRTPVLRHAVAPGTHTIRFEHPSFAPRTVTRTVRQGEAITVTEDLHEPAAPPPDSPRDSRTP